MYFDFDYSLFRYNLDTNNLNDMVIHPHYFTKQDIAINSKYRNMFNRTETGQFCTVQLCKVQKVNKTIQYNTVQQNTA